MAQELDVVVVGGCGLVGLPLALALAESGYRVGIYDQDQAKLLKVQGGEMPFMETGSEVLLGQMLESGRLTFSAEAQIVGQAEHVVIVVGTPLDEFLNPCREELDSALAALRPHLRDDALLILRSTTFPGTVDSIQKQLRESGSQVDVVFCPERIAEGHALEEIRTLPQLIGANEERVFERAERFFAPLGVEVVRLSPSEAELAKLMTNTWRYMKFAVANAFFEIAHSRDIDYNSVLRGMRHHYPRAADFPSPGFAAGPCLFKDTWQLISFAPARFGMGMDAVQSNEGLPNYIVEALVRQGSLEGKVVGILGMAFKGESDDARTSLSYKLRGLLTRAGAEVLTCDPYVKDDRLVGLEEVLRQSDILVIGAPHQAYKDLDLRGKRVVDVWGHVGPISL